MILFHGTTSDFDRFDPAATIDGGIHFGTAEQARMRVSGKGKRLIQAEVRIDNPRRSRDSGGNWRSKIASAKAAGFDSIVYLNRYEGINTETVLKAAAQRVDMDRLNDAELRRFAPELQDSYIVFHVDQIKIIEQTKLVPHRQSRKLK